MSFDFILVNLCLFSFKKKYKGVRQKIEIKEFRVKLSILSKLAEPYGLVSLMLSKAKLNDCGPRRATLILMMVPFTNGNAGRFPSRPSTSAEGPSEPGAGRAGKAEGMCAPPPLCVEMDFTRTFQTTTKCTKSCLKSFL